MPRRKAKIVPVWKVTFWDLPVLIEMKGKVKYGTNGYTGLFETKKKAFDYKWRQLIRIKNQYEVLNQHLPAEYQEQINEMEKEYEGKEISQ